ncbi:MAG: leucine-rich repeat protein [Candidatus Enteromonas sp.]
MVLAEIKTINSSAFAYCGNLKSVLIPNTLERMSGSFEGSELLQKEESGIRYLKFNNNPHYCALSFYGDDEVLSVHPDTKILTSWLFWECKAKQVILPDVEQLPCRLFYQAENLEEIDVPSSVTTIGPEAFSGCENLKRCDISSCRIAKISASTFEDCSSLEEVHLPDGTLVIGSNAFKNCSSLKVLSIPDSVHSIGKGAFEGCASLTAIGISDYKWEYTGPFGPIYFTGYYSTSPAQAAADLVSKYRGVCKKFNGTDEEFEALRNQDSAKNRMLLNIYYSSVKKE